MRLININCNESESFKYSILLCLYYCNIKKNYTRVSPLNHSLNPYIHIKVNKNNDIDQFEKDNPFMDLFIIDVNGKPVFLTRNNAPIKVTIVKLNGSTYSLIKPTINCYRYNISEINRTNKDTYKEYKLTDEIKKELALHL